MIDFRTVDEWHIGNNEVEKAYLNGTLVWKKRDRTEPFYVENITDANETLDIGKINVNAPTITIEISTDRENWSTLGTTDTHVTRTITPGEKLYIRAKAIRWAIRNQMEYYWDSIGGVSKVGGNIMSLLYGSDFTGNETSFKGYGYEFAYLFRNAYVSHLIDAGDLILPATVSGGCYTFMFDDCRRLVNPPILPATTLAVECYYGMFFSCTSLTTAPALPATTLAKRCCQYMFRGCMSLTTAPTILPATTLADYCYQSMFQDCTSLTTAPELPATTLAKWCCQYMFYGCTSLTSAPTILPATTLADYCYQSMFQDCTSLTTAPELPATTLADYCYQSMFYGCTNLNYIKCLVTNIPISRYNDTLNWVDGVAASGTFVKDATMSDWPTNVNGIPEGWTVQDAA